jgi:hypothetical protein
MATTGEPKVKKPRKTRGSKPGPKPGAKAAREAAAAAGNNGGAPAADPPKPPSKANGDQSIKFKFELNERVTITTTQVVGKVRGRAEHVNSRLPRYQVAYSDKTGRFCEDWIDEDQLREGPQRLARRASD